MEREGLESFLRCATWEYDFAKDGGAIGNIVLRGDRLPAGAVVIGGKIHVNTAVTSATTPTLALAMEAATDILPATAKTALTLNAILDVVPNGAAQNCVLTTTTGKGLTLTIAGAVLTAGRITIKLMYL